MIHKLTKTIKIDLTKQKTKFKNVFNHLGIC